MNSRFTFKLKNYRHLWLISCIFMGIWGIFFQRLECCHWSSSFRNPPNIFKSDQLTCILHLFLSMYLTAFLNSRIFNRRPIACTSFGNQSTQVYSTEIEVRPKMLGLRRRYPETNERMIAKARIRYLSMSFRTNSYHPDLKLISICRKDWSLGSREEEESHDSHEEPANRPWVLRFLTIWKSKGYWPF